MRSDKINCIKSCVRGDLLSLLVIVEKVAELVNEPSGVVEEIEKEYEAIMKAEADTVEGTEDSTVEVEV